MKVMIDIYIYTGGGGGYINSELVFVNKGYNRSG